MDVITEILKPKVTIILIGERPGLSTYASLSAYITYEGKVAMAEVGRTVVSNIHENGTNPVEAGAHIATLVKKMLEQKVSGAGLKV
jgi:ethanolamine ammonia-lyase small subunit